MKKIFIFYNRSFPSDPWPYGVVAINLDQNEISSFPKNGFRANELRSVSKLILSSNRLEKLTVKRIHSVIPFLTE